MQYKQTNRWFLAMSRGEPLARQPGINALRCPSASVMSWTGVP
jgi:hypothetical protein